ncbi:MAG: four helix bundle protein [Microgenomates group bacterium]
MGRDFTSLEIYQLAEELVLGVYKVTKNFPKEEIYGITSQLRRAAISIALNIAESYGRFHFKDKAIFLYNARGSLLEVKSILLICFKLGFLDKERKEELVSKADKLGVKINNFINYLKSNKSKSTTFYEYSIQ